MNIDHDDESVRGLFSTLTPQAPESAAHSTPIIARAGRQRRNLIAGGSVVAALAVAAALAGPALLTDRPGDRGGNVAVDTPQLHDPLTVNPCPQSMPAVDLQPIPAPPELSTVRWCRDPAKGMGMKAEEPVPADALVTGFDAWTTNLATIETADPARCAAVSIAYFGDYLLLTLTDGTQHVIQVSFCFDALVGDRTVDAGDVGQHFSKALVAQRIELDYVA